MRPTTIIVILSILLFLASGLGIRQCQSKETETEKASILTEELVRTQNSLVKSRDSTSRFQLLYEKSENLALRADKRAASLRAQLDEAFGSLKESLSGITRKQVQIKALKNLVASGALPKERLSDTLRLTGQPITTDSTIEASVALTTEWAEVYQDQRDSLAKENSTLVETNKDVTDERDEYKKVNQNALTYIYTRQRELAWYQWSKKREYARITRQLAPLL